MTAQPIARPCPRRRPFGEATSLKGDDGIIDLVAVARRLAGDPTVRLTAEERLLAIHYGIHAGISQNSLQRRLRLSGSTWQTEIKKDPPVDPAFIHLPLVHSLGEGAA